MYRTRGGARAFRQGTLDFHKNLAAMICVKEGKGASVEMVEHGRGYKDAASTTQGLEGLITIDGDGVDVDLNGLPDAKINPDLIHIDALGGIYLEQSYVVEVVSSASLLTTAYNF